MNDSHAAQSKQPHDKTLEARAAAGLLKAMQLIRQHSPTPALQEALNQIAGAYYTLDTADLPRSPEAALVAELREAASTDSLTGLLNRAGFDNAVKAQAVPPGREVVMLYLDLDRFKAVNDRYGHAAGDQVLQEVARRLRSVVRPGDLVCRHGGDEFIVAMQVTEGRDMRELAARLSDRIEAPIELDTGQRVAVGVSIGVQHVQPGRGLGISEAIRAADQQMFAAKERRHAGHHAWEELEQDPEVAPDIAELSTFLRSNGGAMPEHLGSMVEVGDRLSKVLAQVEKRGLPLTSSQVMGFLRGEPVTPSMDRRATPSFER